MSQRRPRAPTNRTPGSSGQQGRGSGSEGARGQRGRGSPSQRGRGSRSQRGRGSPSQRGRGSRSRRGSPSQRGHGSPTPGSSGLGRRLAVPGQRRRDPAPGARQSTLDAFLLSSIPAPATDDELEEEPQAPDWHTPPPASNPPLTATPEQLSSLGLRRHRTPVPIPRGVLESPYDSQR